MIAGESRSHDRTSFRGWRGAGQRCVHRERLDRAVAIRGAWANRPSSRSQPQGVFGAVGDGLIAERQGEGLASVPEWPLIAVPGTERVAGLPEDNVFGGVIEVAPVDSEALRGAELAI